MTKKARTKTIPLEYPIEWDGAEITEVTLHRPKGSHLRQIEQVEIDSKTKYEANAGTMAIMSDLPLEAVDLLDCDDFETISGAIGDFFDKRARQKNGVPSSPTAPTT